MRKIQWHVSSIDQLILDLQTDKLSGLHSQEAGNRIKKYGYNEIREVDPTPWYRIFLAQFQDFIVIILFVATIISAYLGEYADSITILAIIILNATLGFIQEYKAEQSMQALRELTSPHATVIRNELIQDIAAKELVPGDIIIFKAGDLLSADARLLDSQGLEVDESALTGESLPVVKSICSLPDQTMSLGDMRNMVFAGTHVVKGHGKAVVCSTGMNTEVGEIAAMLQASKSEDTPLEKRLDQLGKQLVFGCLLICAIVTGAGILRGESLVLMCMSGISLAVAAIPEGLPAIVTVALALGVQRMVKRNAIIRKLPAVETLGCTNIICSDKTGTLTQNVMTVKKIFCKNSYYEITGSGYELTGTFMQREQKYDYATDKALLQCLRVGMLCNNSHLKHNNIILPGLFRQKSPSKSIDGDPTEVAMLVAAAKASLWRDQFEKNCCRIAEIPFESERRYMAVVYQSTETNTYTLYVKGAADTILSFCRYYDDSGKALPLTQEKRDLFLDANNQMTATALRVLAVAYKQISKPALEDLESNVEKDLIFAGLQGMIDPPKPEVKQAILQCHHAGIRTVMITGDHPNTAIAIARELKIYNDDLHKAITGVALDKLSDKELQKVAGQITVYARVSPNHKLRIVQALQRQGYIVAMTGDGVNDAPAVKAADIGIAMGKNGTSVTQEASVMVLADDNFTTIVAAITEGRCIYENIRKFIRYLLACNLGEVLIMFLTTLLGLPLPLLPTQILWINLVTDGLPAMALGVDPCNKDIMSNPPRKSTESIFSRGLNIKILLRGLQIGCNSFLVFVIAYYINNDLVLARTMAFSALVLSQLIHVFDCRSEQLSLFEAGIFKNKKLCVAVLLSLAMHLGVIYIPFCQTIFSVTSLNWNDWLIILSITGWPILLSIVRSLFFTTRSVAHYDISRVQ